MTELAVKNTDMCKKNDEPLDFSALFTDAKRVKHNQYVLTKAERVQQRKIASDLKTAKKRSSMGGSAKASEYMQLTKHQLAQNAAAITLSDNYEAHWPEHKPLKYVRTYTDKPLSQDASLTHTLVAKDMIKKLSMGHFPPDIEIDLHGQTAKQAKVELVAVIFEAKKRHFACISIIHGHGNGVLKRKVPNWLVQHPDVAGFVQAPRHYGGKAGLLVLIGIDFETLKPAR